MTMSELEKITINLGLVDLGQIDLLVQEGFYANRTDFIRTAIRNQLGVHADAVRQTVSRKELVLGLQNYTRRDLEAVRDAGEKLEIRVLGLASIANDVSPEAGPGNYRLGRGARFIPGEPGRKSGAGGPYPPVVNQREEITTMSNPLQAGMAEAMRLTQEGNLNEATATIQRALGGQYTPVWTQDDSGKDQPIEALGSIVNGSTTTEAPPKKNRTEHNLREAPKPPRTFRGMPNLPEGLSGLVVPGMAPSIPTPDVVPAGGQFVERSYTNHAGTRSYKLYIPGGYVGQEVPLVVMLHGCTQGPDDFAAGTHMNFLAEEHTFLVAYPVQAAGANSSRCWNWFKAADQKRGEGEPSIIAGITCEVVGEYNVDPGRVYVAGMSAGGAMAAIVGAGYPDLYTAVGVHSGLAPGAAKDLPSAFAAMQNGGAGNSFTGKLDEVVPAIVFHGDSDRTVHPKNGERLLHHWTNGGPDTLVTVNEGRIPDGYAYTCATHHGIEGNTIMEQWTVHSLGHAWSGGNPAGTYTDPKGPDASAEMMRFFEQHARK